MVFKQNQELRKETLIVDLVGTAIGTFLLGAIGLVISQVFGLTGNEQLMATGATLLLGLLIALFFLWRVFSLLERTGLRYMSKRTGIIDTFTKLTEARCKEDMQREFAKSKDIRLLLQIGRQELGYSARPSYFYSLAAQKDATCQIKILRASAKSPFLSEARARHLGKDPKRWAKHIGNLADEIQFLKGESKAQIEDRQHFEPFLFRIFIFDRVAYVSVYRKLTNNDSEATVYKLTEEGDDSLYFVFRKYFDYLWLKYSDPAAVPSQHDSEKFASWK
jgi:hypothetical protein